MNATEKNATRETMTYEQWDRIVRPDCEDHLRGLDNTVEEMYDDGYTALEARNRLTRWTDTAKADRKV